MTLIKKNDKKSKKFFFILVLLAVFSVVFSLIGEKADAAGTITGRVFQDFNANGNYDSSGGTAANPTAVDVGVAPVTVTVFDSGGVQRGTTATIADGTYSLAATGTGPYRIEFTNLPAGFSPSGRSNDSVGAGTATNSGSTVYFVNDGNTANVNLAVERSEEYCQNNPNIIISCYVKEAQNGANADLDVLLSFPYWGGTVYTDPTSANYDLPGGHSTVLAANQVGPTFGIAYSRSRQRIYSAAYYKHFVGFGPGADNTFNTTDDPGTIYVVNPLTNAVTSSITVPNATTNSHDVNDYTTDNGDTGFNATGKTSLGGMALSDDESSLFVMNLQNRTLYALNPANGAVIASQAVPTSGVPTPGGTLTNCAAGDVRPFAVKYYRSQVYVGMVCSAESTQNATDLRGYVYQVDPTTLAFGASPLFQVALNYTRGSADPGASAAWRPWVATVAATGANFAFSQPVLADIEFDNGNLILGLRDRLGDQALDNGTNGKRTGGDTIRACGSFGAWMVESNGRCGGTGTAPQGTGQGIGNGEFYFQDDFSNPANGANFHDEVSWGTSLKVPGYTMTLNTLLDPISRFIDSTATFDGGIRWFNNTTGASDRAYRIYIGTGGTNVPDLGKANGLGDMVAVCNLAPIEVGNRVWNDANSNGRQDPGEAVIQNVGVQLWGDTDGNGTIDTQIGTATTNANGHYIFGGTGNTNLTSSTCGTTAGSTASRVNASSDDAEQNSTFNTVVINGDDLELTADGLTQQSVGVRFNNIFVPQGATITNAYIEFTPKTNGDAINNGNPAITVRAEAADNSVTFAATNNNVTSRTTTTQSVAWNPANWVSGTVAQTPNLSTVVQPVVSRAGWASNNSMSFILNGSALNNFRRAWSFDGANGSAPRLVVQYTTANLCTLNPNTNYEVRIPATNFNTGQALNGLTPTLVDSDGTTNGDSRDSDGLVVSGSQVMRAFTTGGAGQNNHTYDFGFKSGTTGYSVGNRVWFDTDNDGRVDAAELGISGVSVSIFADANSDGQPDTPGTPVGTLTTDSNGYYRFDNLAAGNYVVRVNPSNFVNGTAFAGYQNTTGNVTGDIDSDLTNTGENGVNPTVANLIQTNGILSNTIILGNTEPVNETDLSATGQGTLDNQGDMTVDFGFYCLSLSGTLWNDTGAGANNNNGILNAGETPIQRIQVRLYNSSGVEVLVGRDGILGTVDDGPNGVITDTAGNYNFRCLPSGQYQVVVNGGGTSSTPTSTTPDDNFNNDDNGLPGSGPFNGSTVANLVTLTAGSTGSQNNNTVTNSTGSTANPTVDFGFISAPTYIKLEGFDVYTNGTETVVKWSTAEEFDNLGFNVYREIGGSRELINRSLIAGGSLRANVNLVATGDSYNWVDNNPKAGAVYYLEDIDMKGNSTFHGPISPKITFSAKSLLPTNATLLDDFNKNDNPMKEKEFVGNEKTEQKETPKSNSSNGKRQVGIAAQEGVKISVKHDAWYRVSAQELQSAGFNLASNRAFWQLFANGEEVPFKLNSDGSIEFFGSGNDKLSTDTKIYYLIEGRDNGQRLGAIDGGNSDGNNEAGSFETTTVRQDRQLYISAILNNEASNFFGAVVTTTAQTSQTLTVQNLDSEGRINLRVKLQGLSSGNHLISLRLANLDLGTVSLTNTENRTFEYTLPLNAVTEGVNQIQLQSIGTGNDVSLVDSISLTYPRRYVAVEGKLRFTVPAGQGVRVGGFDHENINVFEIQNGRVENQVITNVEKVDGTQGISLSPVARNRQLLAIEQTRTESTARVERNIPSTLHDPKNGANFIIITNEKLRESAENLAEIRNSQGLKTAVAAVEDIYDEFRFGEHSPEAIKEFLRTATTDWGLKPRYVLLFGDSSYDPRHYLPQPDRDLVPTKLIDTAFQETGSDAWLADFDDDGIEDISLGRLPVFNLPEANILLSKITRYEAQNARQKSSVMVADRGFDYYNDILQNELPNNVEFSRIERSSLTDSEMHDRIVSQLNTGPMVVTYTGHGSPSLWAATGVFSINDVANINNEKLSIYLMMTCSNGYILAANNDSLAEAFLKKENGGAVAVWASSGTTYPDKQLEISRTLTRSMFNQTGNRFGDLIRMTKQSTTDFDVRRTWHLIGDPTIFVK